MKVVAIVGSLRPGGNTEYALRRVLGRVEAGGLETELVTLHDKTILPCRGCGGCRSKGACVQEDDLGPILEKMKEADGIIVGSPVYFSSASPALMSLLDRAGYVLRSSGSTFAGKVGAPVVVGRRAGHNFTFAQLLLWYFINEFVIPGSTYWNVVFGGAAGARDAEKDEEGLRTLDRFADNLVTVLRKLRS
ncbi:MAG: flavodoxin family protein [Firmicutes bacterium]|nr:flavodoxin family protein [Bacillota bacterium]